MFTLPAGWFWLARAQAPPTDDLTTIDSDGAAHIKRIVPVPKTISAEAFALMVSGKRWTPEPGTKQAADFAEKLHATFPAEITETTLAGVACKVVVPKRAAPQKQDRVLICLHGGGFTSDSGSALEGATIAALTGIRVIAVEYRLAPQYPFPAAVDDAVAVYKHSLQEHAPNKIGVYGTSAGAVLSAQMAVESRRLGLPLPAVLGFFSGYVDLARYGDSRFLYGTSGFTNFSAMDSCPEGLGHGPIRGRPQPPGSRAFTHVRGPEGISSDSVHDFDARSLSERHRRFSSSTVAGRRGCTPDGLRCHAARLLVFVRPA